MTGRLPASLIATLASTLLVTACLQGPATCSEGAATEFRSISHYRGMDLVPQPHVYGACHATFATADDPGDVLEAYRTELEASGYTIQDFSRTPMAGDAESVIGEAVGISATNASFFVSVSAEVLDGQEVTYGVFVDDVDPPN